MYCYYSKANYYGNYHLMMSLGKSFEVLASPITSQTCGLAPDFKACSDVNNGRSSDMSDCFYVAVRHLKIEI